MKMKNQVCSECGKAFEDRRDLLTHKKKIHLNVRDHACCDKCDYSTGMRGAFGKPLKKHLDMHDCDKCDQCPYVTVTPTRSGKTRDRQLGARQRPRLKGRRRGGPEEVLARGPHPHDRRHGRREGHGHRHGIKTILKDLARQMVFGKPSGIDLHAGLRRSIFRWFNSEI